MAASRFSGSGEVTERSVLVWEEREWGNSGGWGGVIGMSRISGGVVVVESLELLLGSLELPLGCSMDPLESLEVAA